MVERSDTTGNDRAEYFASQRDASLPHPCLLVSRFAATPPGSHVASGRLSGGVAALNHRLMAVIPPGWKYLCLNDRVTGPVVPLRYTAGYSRVAANAAEIRGSATD